MKRFIIVLALGILSTTTVNAQRNNVETMDRYNTAVAWCQTFSLRQYEGLRIPTDDDSMFIVAGDFCQEIGAYD